MLYINNNSYKHISLQVWLSYICKSVLAGFMIGLGCIAFSVVLPSKILGSFLFSLGLLSVISQKHMLYTGKIGYVNNIYDVLTMIFMVTFNIIGIYTLCYVFSTYTRLDFSALYPIVEMKLSDSLLSIFLMSVGCGAMMFLAVDNYKNEKHPIFVILPIMFFILVGFEHCIANAGYFALTHTPINTQLLSKLGIMVLGNAVGSLILSKFNIQYNF